MFPVWLIIKLLILLWPIVRHQNEIFSLSTESEGKLLTRRGDKNGSDNWCNYRGGAHACSCFWRKIGFTLCPSVPGVPGRPRGPCRPWGPAAPLSPGNPRSPCTVTEWQSTAGVTVDRSNKWWHEMKCVSLLGARWYQRLQPLQGHPGRWKWEVTLQVRSQQLPVWQGRAS